MTIRFGSSDTHPPIPEPPMDGRLEELLGWWRALGRSPPAWEADHVQALRPWMGTLLVVRYHGADEETARVALYGTTLASVLGEDLTGQSLREAAGPDDPEPLLRGYAKARTTGRPHWCVVALTRDGTVEMAYQRLLLPFRSGDALRILAALRYQKYPDRGWHYAGTGARSLHCRLLD